MNFRRTRDWCVGLSVSRDTTQDGFTITIIILFFQIQLNFED